jgi:hypothetical protein
MLNNPPKNKDNLPLWPTEPELGSVAEDRILERIGRRELADGRIEQEPVTKK